MKAIYPLLLWAAIFLFACSGSRTESTSAPDSTAIDSLEAMANVDPRWALKLERPVTEKFGLILPDDETGVPLYTGMNPNKVLMYITDTAQLEILEGKVIDSQPQNACKDVDLTLSEPFNFYKVRVDGKTGWMWGYDFMRTQQLNIGNYNSKKVVFMTPYYKAEDGDYCTGLQSLFFYDNYYLYFIDKNPNNDELLRWRDQKHLIFVGPAKAGTIQSETDKEKDIVRLRWGVPNGDVLLELGYREGHYVTYTYSTSALQSDVADLEGEEGERPETEGEIVTTECIFSGYSIGDCGHLEFDCGDFADAEFSEDMPELDRTLWEDLVTNEDVGNPEHTGKSFKMTYMMVTGQTCGEPDENGNYYREGPVAMIIGFKKMPDPSE